MTHTPAQAPSPRRFATITPLMLALTLAGGAHAQVETRSKAPIDITADTAEVSNARCVAIWRGAAEAIQEKTHLRADTITVYSRPKAGAGGDGQTACGGADRIEADGHVYYMTLDQNARGDHAVYFQNRDEIVITGDVVVVQGLNVARGSKLTIKVSTHEATMSAAASGAGKSGRVRAVFYPDKTNTAPGADQAAPAKP
jgi:lipopolysaccharide export system protein LptA